MTVQCTEPTVPESAWFKSSYSSGGGGECVEVAAIPEAALVRDSKRPAGGTLVVGVDAWAAFVKRASRG